MLRESIVQTPNKIHPSKYSLSSYLPWIVSREHWIHLLPAATTAGVLHGSPTWLQFAAMLCSCCMSNKITHCWFPSEPTHHLPPTLLPLCICCLQRFTSKQDVIRHYNMHKKRDNSLQHGFMRFSPLDDCSVYYHGCHLNGKSTHYHCMQVNHSKNP